jgi:hypothetical protein
MNLNFALLTYSEPVYQGPLENNMTTKWLALVAAREPSDAAKEHFFINLANL